MPVAERIQVQGGDMLGVHYDTLDVAGVLPYQDNRHEDCCGVDSGDLSRIINAGLRDDDLPVGHIITKEPLSGITRLTPVRAFVGGGITIIHVFFSMT